MLPRCSACCAIRCELFRTPQSRLKICSPPGPNGTARRHCPNWDTQRERHNHRYPRRYGPTIDRPVSHLVVTACQELYGARHDIDFPRMLICSQPAPFYEDRPIDHAALELATRQGLEQLQSAGVAFIGMACNTVHIYHESLSRALGVPLLNIVELAAAQAGQGRLAVVAARPTIESGIYQRAMLARGAEVVDLTWQDEVDALLAAVRDTTEPAAFRALWQPITTKAAAAGLDGVVLACLDLSGMVKHAQRGVPFVDAANSLARELVRQWLERRQARVAPSLESPMLLLRDARPEDAAMLCEAERAVSAAHEGLLVSEADEFVTSSFRDRIASLMDGRGKYLVAEWDGQPVAHASLWPMSLRRVSHVLRLDMCVHLGHWRRGHGELLLNALLDWAQSSSSARKVELLVRSENVAAVTLYRKLGFVEEGRLKERVRLQDGRYVDDISMALMLRRSDACHVNHPDPT
jgi:aspartate racemase